MSQTEIKLPELGENLEEGEVLDIKVAVGDTVSAGQTLLEVEAEKSTVEVPAPVAGRVAQILVKKGDTVQVNQTICLMESNGEAVNGGPKPKTAAAAAPPAEQPARPSRPEAPAATRPPEPVKPAQGDGQRQAAPVAPA